MTIKKALDSILEGNLDAMRQNFSSALTTKAVEKLEERKIDIAKNYFGQIEEQSIPGLNTTRSYVNNMAGRPVDLPSTKASREKSAATATSRNSSDQPGILNKVVDFDTTGSSHIKPSGMSGNYESPWTKRIDEVLDSPEKRMKYGMKAIGSYVKASLTGDKNTKRKRLAGNKNYKKKVDKASEKSKTDASNNEIARKALIDMGNKTGSGIDYSKIFKE